MFEHIGEIAGVEFVAVVHGRARQFATASYGPNWQAYATTLARWRIDHLPRTAGIATLLRRQARRAISEQSRNEKSLPRQTRTSVSRLPSQETAIAARESPGLALTKASATSKGVTVIGLSSSR